MIEIEHVLPADIEKTSFRIIEQELREQGLVDRHYEEVAGLTAAKEVLLAA